MNPISHLRAPNFDATQRREIAVEVKILDATQGLVEYVASDETLDSYREVVRADGWRFDCFKKNAPFVDSHEYGTIEKLVGKVVDFVVRGKKLVETVQWAIDVPSNKLARYGWDMTAAGYLKAVSVGFRPVKRVSRWDSDPVGYLNQVKDLGLTAETGPYVIYLEQQQLELSSVILGANPNALANVAKAYKAGVVDGSALDFLSMEYARREPASVARVPGQATHEAIAQARQRFLDKIDRIIRS